MCCFFVLIGINIYKIKKKAYYMDFNICSVLLHQKQADSCLHFIMEVGSARYPQSDSSTSVMKCIVPLAWGGELLEPDGFYLSCLSDIG